MIKSYPNTILDSTKKVIFGAHCKFRLKAVTDSDLIRPLIPVDSGHPFRMNPDTFYRIPESAVFCQAKIPKKIV
jgi:hypothetical protein